MKKLGFSLVLVLAILLSTVAFAQNQIRVAADSSSGTYGKLLGELVDKCSDSSLDVQALVGNPAGSNGGAVGNLDLLYNNKADAAFMHSDVYLYNAQADPNYNKFKTLIAFWPEPIHVVVLKQSKTKKLGTFSFGFQDFNSLSDLNGFSVGAAGGGVLTSKLLSGQGGGNFTVIDEVNGKAVLNALDNGQISAAVFVGAAPLPNLENAPNKANYKLIPIGESISQRVANIYRPVKISYPGLTNGPMPTLAPLATLISKTFNTATKQTAQAKLRGCVASKLGALQDDGSANWQDVSANDRGIATIPWLDLPSAAAPATFKKK
jgi:TRAP-type uncharacterized transport system substrate-binding protein